jgi:hypothetical protein
MALNYLGINKKHEDIICKLYDITVDEPLLRDKIFDILDQEPEVDFVEEATKVFKDTDNLEIRKILGLDVAQLKSVVDWAAIAELNKKPKTDINEYHCIRIQESLFDAMAESLGYDYTKLHAVKWYLYVYKMLNIPFYIVKSCSGDPVKDEQELSKFFSYAKPNKFKLVSQDETNTIDIENVEQFISQKIKDFLQNLVYPELVTEQDHRKYLHYLVDVIAEKLEDTTEFFKKINNLITIDGFNVKEVVSTLKNDYSDIIPHEPRITTDLPTPEEEKVLEIPRRRKSCKLYKKFAFYKIPKMQFVKDVTMISPSTFEPKEVKDCKVSLPIYDKNHLTFVVEISTDPDDLEGSLDLKCKNFRDKYEQYYRDNNKGEEPPENWLAQIGNDRIFVKPHILNGEKIWSYSEQKCDDSFIPFNDVADEIDPQDLYWIDTYLPHYNFKPSDSTIKHETQLFDAIASVSEEPDVDSVLATKILNILSHYDSYKNNTITDRILPHYTKDRKLVNLLIKTVKDELMKETSDDQ